MVYTVIFKPGVKKSINKFPKKIQPKIIARAESLADNPRPSDMKKLVGKMEGLNRVRVGKYRIIYAIEDDNLIVLIADVDHRKDIYR